MRLCLRFFLFLFFLFSFFLLIHSRDCPNQGQLLPQENVCIYAIAETKSYNDVKKYCKSFTGIPVKIKDIYESATLLVVSEIFNETKAYIGVERNENNTWTYADGTTLTYQNWGPNEPNANISIDCTIMDPQTGKWMAADCSMKRPSLCSVDASVLFCPDGWVYNEKTDFCYYLQNFTYPDSIHWQMYDFSTAESKCKQMGAHLASIHSKDEDNFVYDLVTSNVWDLFNAAPRSDPCYYQWAWIGYYGNGVLGAGNWTDGSPVDYLGCARVSASNWWQVSNDPSCNLHSWVWASISDPSARFVCKMAAKMAAKKGIADDI